MSTTRRHSRWLLLATAIFTAGLSPALLRPAPAQAQGCSVRDGTARAGARVGSNPVRFKYAASPYAGARFDSCRGDVRVYLGIGGTAGSGVRYRINYGQRRGSTIPIFSHTREADVPTGGGEARVSLFSTRELNANVYAFFRVQRCVSQLLGPSTCTPWSPIVTVALGANELTAY